MANTEGTPRFPPGRYGRRRESRRTPRWLVALLMSGVIAVGLAISLQLYRQYGDPEYRPAVLAFQVGEGAAEGTVTIRFQVFKPGGTPGTCIVRARAANGEEVGRAEVDIPAGNPDGQSVTVTYTLATSREPVTGEVVGCAPVGS
ncbi:MAG TPA: DUF4307 domain-containing protein [Micromonosporaceae bacterium]|nr:DUF4307 domain-containing protein [Micromonosporaceae bacterium]